MASPANWITSLELKKHYDDLVDALNAERAAQRVKLVHIHIPPLNLILFPLCHAAMKHAKWMAEQGGQCSHGEPEGPTWFYERMKAHQINDPKGENCARTLGANVNVDEVVKLWMNSPDHRKNILNSDFTKIGVGIWPRIGGGTYWCTIFAGT